MCRKSSFRESERNARIASEFDKEQKEHMEGGAAQALVKQKRGGCAAILLTRSRCDLAMSGAGYRPTRRAVPSWQKVMRGSAPDAGMTRS